MREELKQALKALKSAAAELYRASSYCNTYEVIGNTNDAITEIQKALAAQPAVQEPVAWGVIASNTGRICQVELDADEVEGHNPKHIVPLYTTPPAQQAPEQYTALEQALTRLQKRYAELEAKVAAQPAPVQPVAKYIGECSDGSLVQLYEDVKKGTDFYTTPHAQPAVPDAFGTREGEHPQYIQGWNDCRAEMLKGMK